MIRVLMTESVVMRTTEVAIKMIIAMIIMTLKIERQNYRLEK